MAAEGEDRISALPDALIQAILACLPTTAAAARTSVLSRHWRGLWTRVPALSFHVGPKTTLALGASSTTTADGVDAALEAYSDSAALHRLALIDVDPSTPAPRIAKWLRFASLRLAGELRLSLAGSAAVDAQEISAPIGTNTREIVELPACERVTRIELAGIGFRLQLPSAGAFTSLRALRINKAKFVHGDVGHLVSTQCPRLRELEMINVGLANTAGNIYMMNATGDVSITPAANISIRSKSLERLVLRRVSISRKSRIEVAAPSLYYLALENCGDMCAAATIFAPMLAELIWNHSYDPSHHSIVGADRQIYRLAVTWGYNNRALLQRFDAVDELVLRHSMILDAQGHKKFIEIMGKLPNTKVLEVEGLTTKQNIRPAMLHLLKKYTGLAKLKVDLLPLCNSWTILSSHSSYNCVPEERWASDGVTLDLLEELEISGFTGDEDDTEFLKLLFGCKIKLRRMAIHTRKGVSLSREARQFLWRLAGPHCIVLEFKTTQFHI